MKRLEVLVLEDGELLSRVLKHRLTHEGYSNEVVGSSQAFYGALERYKPDFCFMDDQVPPREGEETEPLFKKNHLSLSRKYPRAKVFYIGSDPEGNDASKYCADRDIPILNKETLPRNIISIIEENKTQRGA